MRPKGACRLKYSGPGHGTAVSRTKYHTIVRYHASMRRIGTEKAVAKGFPA